MVSAGARDDLLVPYHHDDSRNRLRKTSHHVGDRFIRNTVVEPFRPRDFIVGKPIASVCLVRSRVLGLVNVSLGLHELP